MKNLIESRRLNLPYDRRGCDPLDHIFPMPPGMTAHNRAPELDRPAKKGWLSFFLDNGI